MSESSDRKIDAAAADDGATFTVTEFGRKRVGGSAWTSRRWVWFLLWPFMYFMRRKHRRGRFPKSAE
jgi:hypothetical protein